ncbi:O-antigen ligase family protein [Lysobacter korlensis]|uniref:O-antigen ligase family protein n=1 Tax=Lysobacter korlensis TaxID=553636 RepID=A0ABV6RZG0_9GAMM
MTGREIAARLPPPTPAPIAQRLGEWMLFFLFAAQGVRNLAGWPGYLGVAGALAGLVALSLWRHRRDPRLLSVPPELVAFLLFSACSLLWSEYRWATVLGLLAQWGTAAAGIWLALSLSWRQLVAALSSALSRVLLLSLAFEGFVALIVQDRVAPLWTGYGATSPGAYFWSENQLLLGGPVQGIVGNRNLLAFLALLLLLTIGARIVGGEAVRRAPWTVGLAIGTLTLTRSATVIAVTAGLAMLIGVLLLVRRVPPRTRRLFQGVVLAVLSVGLAGVLSILPVALGVLGRSDLTNRVDIWRTVLGLVEQRPALGWGWVSYWAPWVQPYDGLVVIDGVEYLQAHNALLDVLLQLGVVGAAIAGVLAVAALVRGWTRAMGGPLTTTASPGWGPFLLLCALLAQALTESRLLVEGNWALFVALSAKLAMEGWSHAGHAKFTRREPAPVSIEP